MIGRITAVKATNVGTELESAALAGDVALDLLDPGSLDQNGGELVIGTEVFAYTPDAADGQPQLAGALASGYAAETPVYQHPLVPEYEAFVQAEDQQEEVIATVPHTLADRITADIRAGTLDREAVEILIQNGEPIIGEVKGKRPVLDAGFVSARHDSSPILLGLDPLTGAYQVLDGEKTVSVDDDSAYIVSWSCSLELYNDVGGFTLNGDAWASLMVAEDGAAPVQIGIEQMVSFKGKLDNTGPVPAIQFPVGSQSVVDVSPDVDYTFYIGARSAMIAGAARVPAIKAGGLTLAVFGS